ncbi:hypothetical protein [Sphingomonas sp. MS122]|uniref:hypothetical protein n=1 Tax=Sphingomonas sp. MS122 TaxID=3412683 RepID=UPI003C2D24C3
MARSLILAAGAIAALTGGSAAAQSATDTKSFTVTGNVPALCSGGTIAGAGSTFDLGVLVDTSTGVLRTDLAAPPKTLTGAFCSAQSTITVAATPLAAQNFTATPPAGFSRSVNYTATASGWTTTPASFATGAATNAAATQTRATAFSGDITVGIGTFGTSGGNALRLVADTSYVGVVTVTLAVAN